MYFDTCGVHLLVLKVLKLLNLLLSGLSPGSIRAFGGLRRLPPRALLVDIVDMLSHFVRHAKDLADGCLSLIRRQIRFRRFLVRNGILVLLDLPIQSPAVQFDPPLRHVNLSGQLFQPAFREGNAGHANERLSIPISDRFLHQKGGVTVTARLDRIRIAERTGLQALPNGIGVILQPMLLFLPLEESPVAHLPFEVDTELILDLSDGIFARETAGQAKSPFPVLHRTHFEF